MPPAFARRHAVRRMPNVTLSRYLRSWCDAVVPVAVEGRWFQPYGREFSIGDLDPGGIGVGIQLGTNTETGAGGRVTDQLDHDLMAHKRPSPPVLGDMTEHPVLDLVPFARPWGEV